jgi:hypothetical protein
MPSSEPFEAPRWFWAIIIAGGVFWLATYIQLAYFPVLD